MLLGNCGNDAPDRSALRGAKPASAGNGMGTAGNLIMASPAVVGLTGVLPLVRLYLDLGENFCVVSSPPI